MSRADARRCRPGRGLAWNVLNTKREVGRVAGLLSRARDSTLGRYKSELETAKAKRINAISALAEHDLACDVCGRGVS